jgi:ribosome-binding protein aMBF1 (putative translation factor)
MSRLRMDGARVSRAATWVFHQVTDREAVWSCLKDYEYLDQVPQPYRSLFEQEIERARSGQVESSTFNPMPSYTQTEGELAALYESAAEAKGITQRALAIKARVSPTLVDKFYRGEAIPIPALTKIKRAFKEFGIVFGV